MKAAARGALQEVKLLMKRVPVNCSDMVSKSPAIDCVSLGLFMFCWARMTWLIEEILIAQLRLVLRGVPTTDGLASPRKDVKKRLQHKLACH